MASELNTVKELSSVYICKAIEHMPLAEFKVLRLIKAYANSDLIYTLANRQQLKVKAYCIRQYANHLYLFTRRRLHVYLDDNLVTSIIMPEYVADSGPFEITQIDNMIHCRIPHYHNIKYVVISITSNSIISIFNISPYLISDYVAPKKYLNKFNNYIALSFSECDNYMMHCRIHNEDTDHKYIKPCNYDYVQSDAKSIEWLFGDDSDDSDDSGPDEEPEEEPEEEPNYNQIGYRPRQVWHPHQIRINDAARVSRDIECFKSIYYTLTHDVSSIYVCKNTLATMSTNGNCYLYDTHLLNSTLVNSYIFSFPIMQLDAISCINAMYIINKIIYIISSEYLYICDIANYKHTVVQAPKEIRDMCITPSGILVMTKQYIYKFNNC